MKISDLFIKLFKITDKDIPKQGIVVNSVANVLYRYICPTCMFRFPLMKDRCPRCGQRLYWKGDV